MKRTQLYLDEDLARRLAAESRRRHTTVSALVREAVATTYAGRAVEDRSAMIHRIAGRWADRDDLGGTQAFVRDLRRSTRPRRAPADAHGKVPARQRRDH